jgi:2-octaprenylphenol hydroxylase
LKQVFPELGWIVESSLMACEFWESAKRQAISRFSVRLGPAALEFSHDAACCA